MKKTNLVVTATIIATFVISMFAYQPTATEASNSVEPSGTPSPRKIKKTPRTAQDIEVENDETHLTRKPITKSKTKKSAYKEGGVNDTTHRTQNPKNSSTRTNAKQSRKLGPKKPLQFELFFDTYEAIKAQERKAVKSKNARKRK